MSVKSLFREDDRFTPEAMRLDVDITNVLEPIFKAWYEKGYLAREISHICILAVNMIEGLLILDSERAEKGDRNEQVSTLR